MGEDSEQQETSWDKLPVTWPDHLDDAVHALNHRLLPALKFSPKELLLGLVTNTPRTSVEDSASTLRQSDVLTQMAYVEQQHLDGYEETVRHALKRKAAFDKKILQRMPGEVTFKIGQRNGQFRAEFKQGTSTRTSWRRWKGDQYKENLARDGYERLIQEPAPN